MQYRVEENLKQIQEEIVPYKPNIIAVTKYFDTDAMQEAYAAGIRDFGESRVIEASEKISRLPDEIISNSKFHFIGHLQGNKVKKAVERFDIIHSVDTVKLAEKISEQARAIGKVQDILLQINIAQEIQKTGFSKAEIEGCFKEVIALDGVRVLGMMCMAPLGESEDRIRALFKEVREVKEAMSDSYGYRMPELSMGMSQDYKIAAQEGSTMLRIGRRLFS